MNLFKNEVRPIGNRFWVHRCNDIDYSMASGYGQLALLVFRNVFSEQKQSNQINEWRVRLKVFDILPILFVRDV